MSTILDETVDMLNQRGQSIFVATTGAGASIIRELWRLPGASIFLAGGIFPYGREQIVDLLGFKPKSFCSRETALDLAIEACIRAARGGKENPLGLGITATVGTTREHRGGNRAYAAIVGNRGVQVVTISLPDGQGPLLRSRHEDTIVHEVLETLDIYLSEDPVGESPGWEALFTRPVFSPWGRHTPTQCGCYFPVTLNPMHEGHREVRVQAQLQKDLDVTYTVCTTPTHKEPMQLFEALKKVAMVREMDPSASIEFTRNDPLFVDKFGAKPGSIYVMGVDTFERMLNPQWGPSAKEVLQAAEDTNCLLVVADRNGRSVYDVMRPAGYDHKLSELHVRFSRSSTEIRNGR